MGNLDEEKIEEIKEIYNHFDADRNGQIDFEEFTRLIDALEGDMPTADLKTGFGIIDSDHNKSIDFDEFIEWWADQ